MAQQLWGTYSVADHCTAYPLVSDIVLYDRLPVPVPPCRNRRRMEALGVESPRLARQRLLLDELSDYVTAYPGFSTFARSGSRWYILRTTGAMPLSKAKRLRRGCRGT